MLTPTEFSEEPTQELSVIDKIRGAYGDAGSVDVEAGDPRPDMPDTLCLLVDLEETTGRTGGRGGTLSNFCRFPLDDDP